MSGVDVVVTGAGPWVRGRDAVEVLAQRGYRRLYLQTGPRLLASALRDGVLARLYVTVGHRIVGGESFDTMVRGDLLGESGAVRLGALYLDEGAESRRRAVLCVLRCPVRPASRGVEGAVRRGPRSAWSRQPGARLDRNRDRKTRTPGAYRAAEAGSGVYEVNMVDREPGIKTISYTNETL